MAWHSASRRISRHSGLKQPRGHGVIDHLANRGMFIRNSPRRGVDVEAAYQARKVARLEPCIRIKG
jgi:hypothetical protein